MRALERSSYTLSAVRTFPAHHGGGSVAAAQNARFVRRDRCGHDVCDARFAYAPDQGLGCHLPERVEGRIARAVLEDRHLHALFVDR
jgi:hypothetical protein